LLLLSREGSRLNSNVAKFTSNGRLRLWTDYQCSNATRFGSRSRDSSIERKAVRNYTPRRESAACLANFTRNPVWLRAVTGIKQRSTEIRRDGGVLNDHRKLYAR